MKNHYRSITLLSIFIIMSCNGDSTNEPTSQKKEYIHKYFANRRWCPQIKQFSYLNPILNKKEEEMTKYYKVSHIKNTNKIAIEMAYKNKDIPVGNWYYTDEHNNITSEKIYKKGKLTEEWLYEFDDHQNKKSESHFVYQPKKRLILRSIYFYDRSKSKKGSLAKIENYNAGLLNVNEYVKFKYDDKGRLIKKSVYIFNKELKLEEQLKSYSKITYNSNDQKSKEDIFNEKDRQISHFEFEYNDKQLLKEKREFKIENSKQALVKKISYKYNHRNNIVKKEEFEIEKDSDNSSLTKLSERKYCYDKSGCIKLLEIFDGNSVLVDWKGKREDKPCF